MEAISYRQKDSIVSLSEFSSIRRTDPPPPETEPLIVQLTEPQRRVLKTLDQLSPGLNSAVFTIGDLLYLYVSEEMSKVKLKSRQRRNSQTLQAQAVQINHLKLQVISLFLLIRTPADGTEQQKNASIVAAITGAIVYLDRLGISGRLHHLLKDMTCCVKECPNWIAQAQGTNASFESHVPLLRRFMKVVEGDRKGWDLVVTETADRARFEPLAQELKALSASRLRVLSDLLEAGNSNEENLCAWAEAMTVLTVPREIVECRNEREKALYSYVRYCLYGNIISLERLFKDFLLDRYPDDELSEWAKNFNAAFQDLMTTNSALVRKLPPTFQKRFLTLATALVKPLVPVREAGSQFSESLEGKQDLVRKLQTKRQLVRSWSGLWLAAAQSYHLTEEEQSLAREMEEGGFAAEFSDFNEIVDLLRQTVFWNMNWIYARLGPEYSTDSLQSSMETARPVQSPVRQRASRKRKPKRARGKVDSRQKSPQAETHVLASQVSTDVSSPIPLNPVIPAPVEIDALKDLPARIKESDWKQRGAPEHYRIHSSRLLHLRAELLELREAEGRLRRSSAGRKLLMFRLFARCHEFLESALVRTLAKDRIEYVEGVHVLDAVLPEGFKPLGRQHSLVALATVLRESGAQEVDMSLMEELNSIHSLAFYLESVRGLARGSRGVEATLEQIHRASTEVEIHACEQLCEQYVQRTLHCVHQLLADQHNTVSVRALVNVLGLLDPPSSPSNQEVAVESTELEAEQETQEHNFHVTTDKKGAHQRLRRCEQLLRALLLSPTETGPQRLERRGQRNAALQHVQRYVQWLPLLLDSSDHAYPLSETLPALDALHRSLKESVMAAIYHYPFYAGQAHLSSLPTREGSALSMHLDNNVCATYQAFVKALTESGRSSVVSQLPRHFERRFGWLAEIHDRLYYPDRKRAGEGVHRLVSRLIEGGRTLRRCADAGIEPGWSQQTNQGPLDPEAAKKAVKDNTNDLLETAIYPGLDALYLILRSAFGCTPANQ